MASVFKEDTKQSGFKSSLARYTETFIIKNTISNIYMGIFDKTFREILSSQVISLIIGLISGTMLAIYKDEILLIPSMLIIIPGFLEIRGDISGSFASRLSSGLFLKVIKRENTKMIKGNLIASFILAIPVSLALGLIAFLFNYFVLGINMPKIILIPLIAGIIVNGIEITMTLFATFYLFRKGYDPNNIMGPFITSTSDIIGTASLILVTLIII